jgi:hypothetical protein
MDDVIQNCVNKLDFNDGEINYTVVEINGIGEVVIRNDNHYGACIAGTTTPPVVEDDVYHELHIKFMTYPPLVLYMCQHSISEIPSVVEIELLMNEILTANGISFNDWYSYNKEYFESLTLIWVFNYCEHLTQSLDTSPGLNYTYRQSYLWLINYWCQAPPDE